VTTYQQVMILTVIGIVIYCLVEYMPSS